MHQPRHQLVIIVGRGSAAGERSVLPKINKVRFEITTTTAAVIAWLAVWWGSERRSEPNKKIDSTINNHRAGIVRANECERSDAIAANTKQTTTQPIKIAQKPTKLTLSHIAARARVSQKHHKSNTKMLQACFVVFVDCPVCLCIHLAWRK